MRGSAFVSTPQLNAVTTQSFPVGAAVSSRASIPTWRHRGLLRRMLEASHAGNFQPLENRRCCPGPRADRSGEEELTQIAAPLVVEAMLLQYMATLWAM
jgi:hypothetical protein